MRRGRRRKGWLVMIVLQRACRMWASSRFSLFVVVLIAELAFMSMSVCYSCAGSSARLLNSKSSIHLQMPTQLKWRTLLFGTRVSKKPIYSTDIWLWADTEPPDLTFWLLLRCAKFRLHRFLISKKVLFCMLSLSFCFNRFFPLRYDRLRFLSRRTRFLWVDHISSCHRAAFSLSPGLAARNTYFYAIPLVNFPVWPPSRWAGVGPILIPFPFLSISDLRAMWKLAWVIVFWLPRTTTAHHMFVCLLHNVSLSVYLSLSVFVILFFLFLFFFQVVSRAFLFRFISFVLYGSDHFDPMFIISDVRTLQLWWFVLAMKLALWWLGLSLSFNFQALLIDFFL